MARKPVSHLLRRGRVSLPRHIYLITTVTAGRAPVFSDCQQARALIRELRLVQQDEWAKISFVVMPDHLHWLLQLGDEQSLSSVVRRVKGRTSKRLSTLSWQAGFHDRAIRRDEDLRSVCRYIIANPLRANLVSQVGHYPHWDCIYL